MSSRKKTLTPPRSQWEATLQETEGADPTQAGEIEADDEDSGSKGIDAETGDGGYGGDAVLAGYEEANAQPERPLDREIHGDPRTHEGESYPDDAKVVDERQGPIGSKSVEDDGR